MITAEEFVLEINDTEQSKNFKLANVIDLFENSTAKVQFDGEDAPSEKQYAYLESYTPEIFDRVLLAVTGGTYVILGKVNYNIPPPTPEELDRYLFDQKLVTMTKGLSVAGGASIVGNVGVNGDITGINLSMTGNLQAGSISTTGALNATGGGTFAGEFTVNDDIAFNGKLTTKLANLASIPSLASTNISCTNISANVINMPSGNAGKINNSVTFNRDITMSSQSSVLTSGNFRHTGSQLGFFNGGTNSRPTTKSDYDTLLASATLPQVITKLNNCLTLLRRYNLAP